MPLLLRWTDSYPIKSAAGCVYEVLRQLPPEGGYEASVMSRLRIWGKDTPHPSPVSGSPTLLRPRHPARPPRG